MSEIVLDSYSEANYGQAILLLNNWDGYYSAFGQSFITPNTEQGYKLTKAVFYLKLDSATTYNLTAEIYLHSGTYGVNSVPTGAPLATSDAVTSGLTSTFSLIPFTFSGANQITLTPNTHYVIVVKRNSANGGLFAGIDYMPESHSGNWVYRSTGGNWGYGAETDFIFYVYGLKKYALTITETAHVTTDPAEGTYLYDDGASVEVTATNADHYVLTDWLLDGVNVGATSNPYTVNMDSNHELTPVMTLYALTITTPSNGATYPTGTTYYTAPTETVVYAKPNRGYLLDSWTVNSVKQQSKATRYTAKITGAVTLTPAFTAEYTVSTLPVFNNLKASLQKNLGVSNFNVTLYALSLGTQDPDTGIPAKTYTSSTIEMLLITKETKQANTAIGKYVALDALGFTTSYIRTWDKIVTSTGKKYIIDKVTPQLDGAGCLVFFEAELTEEKIQ